MSTPKPDVTEVWSSAGTNTPPAPAFIQAGWQFDQIPENYEFNYIDNRQDLYLNHLNEYGIPHWDALTEYPEKSWSRSAVNDVVYFANSLVTAGSAEPSVNPSEWTAISLSQPTDVIRRNGSVVFVANQSMGGFKITGTASGTSSGDYVNKGQMDSADNLRLLKSGGTMTGSINMGSDKITGGLAGTSPTDFVIKSQLDAEVAEFKDRIKVASAIFSESGGVITEIDYDNVTSVTRTAQGRYTLNIAGGTVLNTDYTFSASAAGTGSNAKIMIENLSIPKTTSTFSVSCVAGGGGYLDSDRTTVNIFGGQ